VRYRWDDDILVVKICLAPNERAAHPAPHTHNHVCPLDV
jgi:hypothetical protein